MAGFLPERRCRALARTAGLMALLAVAVTPCLAAAQARGPTAPPAGKATAPIAKAAASTAPVAEPEALVVAPAGRVKTTASPPIVRAPGAPATAAEVKKPWGVLVSEDGKHRIELLTSEVIVGSAATAGARIDHATVSPRHARLNHKDGVVTITDLGSKFMTLVAGTELKKGKPMRLVQRTLVTFGAVGYDFAWGERAMIPPTRDAPSKAGGDKATPGAGKAGKRKGARGKP